MNAANAKTRRVPVSSVVIDPASWAEIGWKLEILRAAMEAGPRNDAAVAVARGLSVLVRRLGR